MHVLVLFVFLASPPMVATPETTPQNKRFWSVASPDLATVRINHETQTVTTEAMFFWAGKTRFIDARRGCVLE